MQEIDIDIPKNETMSAFDLFADGKIFHYVIVVSDVDARAYMS